MKLSYAPNAMGNENYFLQWNIVLDQTRSVIKKFSSKNPWRHNSPRPWSRSLTKVLGLATIKDARIIGITGHRRGAGVSLVAQELAKACVGFGKKTILINASGFADQDDALFLGEAIIDGLHVSALADLKIETPSSKEQFRQHLESSSNNYDMVIIDLPPVGDTDGKLNAIFNSVGAACDIVFLVCLSGVVTKSELADCLERCKIVGINLAGLLLNDWKIPGSFLLSDT